MSLPHQKWTSGHRLCGSSASASLNSSQTGAAESRLKNVTSKTLLFHPGVQHTHVVDELGLVPQELLERAKAELDRHVLRVVGLEEDGQAADSLRAAGRRGAATCGAHARKTRVEGGTSRGLVQRDRREQGGRRRRAIFSV